MKLAVFRGSKDNPQYVLKFDYHATHETQRGVKLQDWVRKFQPTFDKTLKAYVLTHFNGLNPHQELLSAGFLIDDREAIAQGLTMQELMTAGFASDSDTVTLTPRFTTLGRGEGQLPISARDTRNGFVFPISDVFAAKIDVPNDVKQRARNCLTAPTHPSTDICRAAASLSGAVSYAGHENALSYLSQHGFSLDPDLLANYPLRDNQKAELKPYQVIGATAMIAGHTLLGDEPGVGKTWSVIAAATAPAVGAQKIIILCPAVAHSMWLREFPLVAPPHFMEGKPMVSIASQQKGVIPDGPGVIVIPITYLVSESKEELLQSLCEWGADVVILDEAHALGKWETQRSRIAHRIAYSSRRRFALTGTPLVSSSPMELAPILEFTGHLGPVFGGYTKFVNTFLSVSTMKVGRFGQRTVYRPRKAALPQLREALTGNVWVLRTKSAVLAYEQTLGLGLPPKNRVVTVVEPNTDTYQAGHAVVIGKVFDWADRFFEKNGTWPSGDDVAEYIKNPLPIAAPLLLAAGKTKIPHAQEWLRDFLGRHPARTDGLTDDPVIVWGIHKDVLSEIEDYLKTEHETVSVARIDGSTSAKARGTISQDFQAGKIQVLLCNIVAAGVALTLTRGNRALFVEFSWVNSSNSQAEDRIHRMGQKRPVTCEVLVAEGTLDHALHGKLVQKAHFVNAVVVGGDNDTGSKVNARAIRDVIEPLVQNAVTDAPHGYAQRKAERGGAARVTELGVITHGATAQPRIGELLRGATS